MTLDNDACWRAAVAHDARFDGRFFVAVSSTGIYCRPVCRVRTPRRENCSFFATAAAAEAAGYRPCLRCRPELAPGHANVDARGRLAHAAARLIEDAGASEGCEGIAARLGVTGRHLRRVFQEEYGVAPVEYAQTHRLLLAKRLLTDTALPITDVALDAGFGSVRRFNALFRERYRLSPGQLRTARAAVADTLTFELAYRPPYDWASLLGFLSARTVGGVEAVADGVYRRVVRVVRERRSITGWIEISPCAGRNYMRVTASAALARVAGAVLARARRLLDLDCDPHAVAEVLGPLAAGRPGLRVPGAFDGFEVAVRAVLGQQVSVAAARTLATRFAEAFGTPVETPFAELRYAFPAASRIAAIDCDAIVRLGILRSRAETIMALARSGIRLSPGVDAEAAIASLQEIRGIGPWTAQYIAMRALSWPDAFPHGDLGLAKALGERSASRVLEASQAWRPWRAYATMHLWTGGSPNGTVR